MLAQCVTIQNLGITVNVYTATQLRLNALNINANLFFGIMGSRGRAAAMSEFIYKFMVNLFMSSSSMKLAVHLIQIK